MRATAVLAAVLLSSTGLVAAGGLVSQATRPATRPAMASAEPRFYTNDQGQVAGGNDVVAYFDGKAIKGLAEFEVVYGGAKFLFASQAHKDAFTADPGKYAPQYGGWCAMGMAGGYKAPTDPQAFTVMEGKLYLNYSPAVTEMWKKDAAAHIAKADANWVTVGKK